MTDSTSGKKHDWQHILGRNIIGSNLCGKNMIGSTFWEKTSLAAHSAKQT
jgi:hypothetical protein